jgi:hypothetical protein
VPEQLTIDDRSALERERQREVTGAVELVGALLGSLLGAVVALVVAGVRLRSEARHWRQDALVRGMGFLTGGRQNRNVGIGLIESLILSQNVPREIRPAVDNVLWSQLLYVAYHGDIREEHENVNARRLITLVEQSPDTSRLPKYAPETMAEIRRRVDAAAP